MNLSAIFPDTDAITDRIPFDRHSRDKLSEKLSLDKLSLDSLPLDWLSPGNLPLNRLSPANLPLPHRRRKSAWERLVGADAPFWSLAAAAFAGVLIGGGVAMLMARRSAAAGRPRFAMPVDEIKAAWPELSKDDIDGAEGNVDRLADTIRSRTGENADSVRAVLQGMAKRHEHEGGQAAS